MKRKTYNPPSASQHTIATYPLRKNLTYLYNLRRNSLQIRPLVGHKVNRWGQSSDLYWHTALSADSAATALVLGAEQQLGRVQEEHPHRRVEYEMPPKIMPPKPKSDKRESSPGCSYPSQDTKILARMPKSEPRCPNPTWDAQILARMRESEPSYRNPSQVERILPWICKS